MKWQKSTQRNTVGSDLISGKVRVGTAYYDGLRSRDDPASYSWKLLLPGKDRSGKTVDEDEAKAACELAFAEWLDAAGLQLNGCNPVERPPGGRKI